MALNTYANLKTAIRDHAHRNDLSDDLLDDFIDMAESEMNGRLTIRDEESRETNSITTSSRFLALPTNFLKMRRFSVIDDSGYTWELEYRTPEAMDIEFNNGRPTRFTITSQIEFNRVPDQTYTVEMAFIKKETALSSSNTSNGILSRFPQIYLYGALSFLFDWARDEQRSGYYKQQFIAKIAEANHTDRRGRYGAVPRTRIEGWQP